MQTRLPVIALFLSCFMSLELLGEEQQFIDPEGDWVIGPIGQKDVDPHQVNFPPPGWVFHAPGKWSKEGKVLSDAELRKKYESGFVQIRRNKNGTDIDWMPAGRSLITYDALPNEANTYVLPRNTKIKVRFTSPDKAEVELGAPTVIQAMVRLKGRTRLLVENNDFDGDVHVYQVPIDYASHLDKDFYQRNPGDVKQGDSITWKGKVKKNGHERYPLLKGTRVIIMDESGYVRRSPVVCVAGDQSIRVDSEIYKAFSFRNLLPIEMPVYAQAAKGEVDRQIGGVGKKDRTATSRNCFNAPSVRGTRIRLSATIPGNRDVSISYNYTLDGDVSAAPSPLP